MLCNANPRNKENKNQRTMVTKKSNEAQGPCQKDSIRLSLLHPKLFRCIMSIGVLILMGMISNSIIGIKVWSLYQFTYKHHRILYLRHKYFWFVYSLSSLRLVTIWTDVSRLSTKVTNSCRLILCIVLRKGGLLRFRLFQINHNLLRRCTFYRFSLTHREFDNFTHKGFRRR